MEDEEHYQRVMGIFMIDVLALIVSFLFFFWLVAMLELSFLISSICSRINEASSSVVLR